MPVKRVIKSRGPTEEEKPYLVSDRTCAGCEFYQSLGCAGDKNMFCAYFMRKSVMRVGTCAECTVKERRREKGE
jgi:hypothetical protein